MFAPWKKSCDKPRQCIKGRDITLPTDVLAVKAEVFFFFFKAEVFPVVMYGCESWTIKRAEHRRIDVFELCCGGDS